MNSLAVEKGDLVRIRADDDIYEVLSKDRSDWWVLISTTSRLRFDVHQEVIIPITDRGTKVAIRTGIL